MAKFDFPALPLSGWQATRDTIHKYTQVLGEIRGALTPVQKHWWHINLRPDVTGLTTTPIPVAEELDFVSFKMLLDFTEHKLRITTGQGQQKQVSLRGQSVSEFWDETLSALSEVGIHPQIDNSLFKETAPGSYEPEAAQRFWRVVSQIDVIFKQFKAGMHRETSPVNLWPHHFDLAFVWFSGRLVSGVDPDDRDYADEQMSFGFSSGDETIAAPYFYISAYPMPEKLKDTALPADVTWNTAGFEGARMMYETLVKATNPEEKLLEYLRTLYQAGSKLMQY
ncbi:MAG: DUF5996 family protein [bacterium]